MLRVCDTLRVVDVKSKRLGLAGTETDYLRALQDAMANMDRCVEVEVLKSLGDVNLERGQLDKSPENFDRAMVLYRTALIRCNDADVGESFKHRYHYAKKIRLGKLSTASSSYEPLTNIWKSYSLANVAEMFLDLDRRFTACFVSGKSLSLLIEYTRLMVEGIVNGDNMLEVEAIKSLGDVYLKRGTETRDTTCLTKATALYNTALTRCERFQDTVALIHRLLYTARIRQRRSRPTGKKIPKQHRVQQQQQCHVSRDFLMTSPNTDIGEARDQKSMSYEEHLTIGDRALTDGKLDVAEQNFASALRLIHNPSKPDRGKEAECLSRLGDVYVRRGETTKEGRKFTQAAALYNAAMARTNKNKSNLTGRLQNVEQSFLHDTTNVETKYVPPDLAIGHKKRLQEMRTCAKSQLEAIDQQHNPYQYDEDDPVMITVEAERAEAVKALFKNIAKDRQNFIQDLLNECIDKLGPSPCEYASIGLGSQATELVTPYSDLEFAILIEEGKDNDNTRQHFINLTHYLHLKVINLGETILPAMAIPSLNDFPSEDPEKDWFFDSVTPRGFAFDGFMPWASKTPFGRDQTKKKDPVSLIQTPAEMAKFQLLDVSVAEGYHLSDILRRVVFLTGEEALVTTYMGKLNAFVTNDRVSQPMPRLSASQILSENKEQLSSYWPTGELLNVKRDIYRFPGIAIEVLALCCQITLASAWTIIEELKEMEKINEENATHLVVLTSISAELRLRTYLNKGEQQDSMSPLAQMKYDSNAQEISGTTLSSIFHVPDIQVLFRYYYRAIPLKKCIADSLQVQQKSVLKMTLFDISHECRGRISKELFLYDRTKSHLEAALIDSGSDVNKRAEILQELGSVLDFYDDITKGISLNEEALRLRRSIHGDNAAHPGIAGSLNNLGLSCIDLGDHKKAINYFEQSLSMLKTVYGVNTAHPNIATSLNNLGMCWTRLGDHKKAIHYHELSLSMRKSIYGENTAHRDIATSLNNLGASRASLGDYKKAISYHEQSLTMKKIIFGENTAHPDIAASLNNLGISRRDFGDHKKAIRYYEQSLSMRETIYGENTAYPESAGLFNNLGVSWNDLGDHEKAISYFEQSLSMRKTIYGENTAHPEIALSLNNLGASWGYLGDHRKQNSYYEQSLSMVKTIYGKDTAHPDIALLLYNLGSLWSDLGDHKKASSYYEQSLSMKKTIYGKNTAHPDIAATLNNLGVSLNDLGDYKKAIHYFEQSLSMRKTIYGENTAHPYIARSLNNLGWSWSKLDDHNKSFRYCEQSLSMMKTIYGENTAHLDIAKSLKILGASWSNLGNHKKAIRYYEQLLSMMKTIYGENTAQLDIAKSLNNLGASWSNLGDHKKAFRYYEQSLSMMKTIYGENTAHLDIAKSLKNLGASWSNLGNHKKAIRYYEQLLSMMKTIYGENTAHLNIALSLNSLGSSWGKLGDFEEAIRYFELSLSMNKTVYGETKAHPDIALSLLNLGLSWGNLSNHKKAIIYFEQSLTMYRIIYGNNSKNLRISETLKSLHLAWANLGNVKKALEYKQQLQEC
ncbi:uncharacterized protein LOC118412786 [Branchiostoma floridae]|uniref:Uncharacterized protein LOC118412786 n=1 Tax=Branchiostoma floridae TaxID=7739 RepID=A0A9J7MLL2_BRAFL|nr:uncharacterized protein LOC118412786 [Branchiostoma floridae]